MLTRLSKSLVTRGLANRRFKSKTHNASSFRQVASSSATTAPNATVSRKWYRLPIFVSIGAVAVAGAAYGWYKWKEEKDVVPYSDTLARACMQTLKHGGSGQAIYAAATVLAEMSSTSSQSTAHSLVFSGVLDTCTVVLNAHFDPTTEAHRTQGRTVFQMLRVLDNLTRFSDIADQLLTQHHAQLVELIVKSAFLIENGAEDSWVKPLSEIFAELLNASVRSKLHRQTESSENVIAILERPHACSVITKQLLPYCDASKTKLVESTIRSISSHLNSESIESTPLYVSPSAKLEDVPIEKLHLSDLIQLIVSSSNCYHSAPYSSNRSSTLDGIISENVAITSAILSQQEEFLLDTLKLRHESLLSAHQEHDDEHLHHNPLLFNYDYTPWYHKVKLHQEDDQTKQILQKRSELLSTYDLLIASLPTQPKGTKSVSCLLESLLSITDSRDEDTMFAICKRKEWMNSLLYTWLLLEPSGSSSSQNSATAPIDRDARGNEVFESKVEVREDLEACPVKRPSLDESGLERNQVIAATYSIRKNALELLSRLASIPSVASDISVTTCLCSVQLLESTGNLENGDADKSDIDAARSAVEQLRPIHQIASCVSRYAPSRLSGSNIERIITMNPSELESMALISVISQNPDISEKILDNSVTSSFVMSPIIRAAKSIPTVNSPPINGPKRQSATKNDEKVRNTVSAGDALLDTQLRLSLQSISFLARANPSATLSKLSSYGCIPFLRKCLESDDAHLKPLSVLTLAHLSSVTELSSSQQPVSSIQRKGSKIQIVPPKMLQGVSVLYPDPSPKPKKDSKPPPALPVDLISNEDFDIVFIHGINGNPITTWRVEKSLKPPSASTLTRLSKTNSSETYQAYMNYLNDPNAALKEEEAAAAICWPRDWLPHYVPRARILTVSYHIALTKWGANETRPLKDQAADILQKLRLFGVGEKPVLFIAHSFGGLIVKEMLSVSESKEEYEDILKQTRAIMFFSTPHTGSLVADLANSVGDYLFRGSSAVLELFSNNWYLPYLNARLPIIAPNVKTLSIGEIETCFLASNAITSSLGADKYLSCHHIVPDESSNPGWKGPNHRFVKLQRNHWQVCKPESQEDERFTLVLDFLKANAPQKESSEHLEEIQQDL